MKAAEAIAWHHWGDFVSWILSRVEEVVSWVFENLWVLVIDVGGLLNMYMVTRK